MILSLERVCVDYGTGPTAFRAVHDVTLDLTAGTVVGLVGESGSGKSTLGRAIAGLEPISAGTLDTSRLPWRGRRSPVQYVFQDANSALNPRMTVGRIIAEGLDPRSIGRGEMRRAVQELMNQVHLDPAVIDQRPPQLSGGQRQRVAIARALSVEPAILVADEITSALDASVQAAVLNLLGELKRQRQFTMIFISHDISVVNYLSDEVVVLRNGRVVEHGATKQVIEAPRADYTRELLASVPTVPYSR